MRVSDVIIKPRVTEKSIASSTKMVYTFEVSTKANKDQIKNAIEALFKVKVGDVKTSIKKGRTRRVGKLMRTQKISHIKIAYVKVIEGKIDIFPKS